MEQTSGVRHGPKWANKNKGFGGEARGSDQDALTKGVFCTQTRRRKQASIRDTSEERKRNEDEERKKKHPTTRTARAACCFFVLLFLLSFGVWFVFFPLGVARAVVAAAAAVPRSCLLRPQPQQGDTPPRHAQHPSMPFRSHTLLFRVGLGRPARLAAAAAVVK